MEWKIKDIVIKNQVGLSPMAGISNPAYIKICEEMGIGFATTELLSTEAIIRGNDKTFDMLNGMDKINIPVAVQIFGSNPDTMAKASKILCDKYPFIRLIDINMGCPVPKVAVKSLAGSALLKDPDKVRECVSKVVSTVKVPVTVKIRSGWDASSINAPYIAKICEEAGASAITIHARTRSQGYSGKADLNVIKQVKESVSIPVIGNGDINSIESAKKMLDYTKCDAIMVGRAAMGNPWLLKEIRDYLDNNTIIDKPSYEDRINMCFHHLDYLMKTKCEKVAVLEMRSQVAWYIKSMPDAQKIKNMVFKATTRADIEKILNMYLKELKNSI